MRSVAITLCAIVTCAVIVFLSSPAAAQGLTVYQDLEEATSRIGRLESRPYQKLVDKNGYYQSERMIFHDLETGAEVWSLTQEECTDIANIERRCAWSCNGQYISFIGNKVFYNYGEEKLWKRTWAGFNYVANADGSERRKLWGKYDGRLILHQDKFNNWDQRRPNVLYYAEKDTLWKVTLGEGEKGNTSEAIYRFPTASSRIIQEISDDNLMLIEEEGAHPNCVVIDLNKDPKEPRFCMTAPLKGAVHPGSFRFRRSAPIVTGGYEDKALRGNPICFRVDKEKGLVETTLPNEKSFGIQMAHLWYGAPDDRVVFSGEALGQGFGLWLKMPGKPPVKVATVNDGHPTWCGHDPDWYFYACGTGDVPGTEKRYQRRLIAGKADNSVVKVLCTPFDRRRGAKEGGYDAIPRPNQSPDATKCWFHSSMLMPTNAYTGSYIVVFRRPYAPTDVKLEGAKLAWTPHKLSYEVKGYFLYRKEPAGWQQVGDLIPATSVAVDKDGTYMLTSLEWSGLESDTSSPTITLPGGATGAPVKAWDKVAPAAPAGFTVTKEADGQYRLNWQKSPDADLRYYNIYASDKSKPKPEPLDKLGALSPVERQKRLIASPQETVTEYLDWTAPTGGATLFYAITAVDRQGNESAPACGEPRP